MENDTAEAERHFESLTLEEKLKELWFAGRENQQIGQEIRLYQREQNGNVAKVVRELNLHLDEHRDEKAEMRGMKKLGGIGTGAIMFLVALGNSAVIWKLWG